MRTLSVVFLGVLLVACGPDVSDGPGDDDDDDMGIDGGPDQPDAYQGMTGAIQGTVWAPGNAPGMVPSGQEIPIYNALIYVSPTRPQPIPQQTYCEECVDPPGKHAFSDHKGNFTLDTIVPGDYWLVIQKGQFRLEQQVSVTTGTIALTAEQSTLPSETNEAEGKWIPRIAMAVGNYDDLEDILGKMGLGQVDSSGRYIGNTAAGYMDIYSNGGSGFTGLEVGTLGELVSDPSRLMQYHIVFIPCASTSNTAALQNQQNLRNIRDFVAAGGKLYVTDWSGEWHDNVFPEPIELGGGVDTPATAYDAMADTWNTALFGSADGGFYDSNNAEVVDSDMHTWLHGQMGPTAFGGTETYDASLFDVEGNWNTVENLVTMEVGVDDEGLPVFMEPKAWIIGGQGTSTPKKPLTVTYEPTGCGRVLFSTYHTTDTTHVGLVPQERVLLYLIMEIGVCFDDPIIE